MSCLVGFSNSGIKGESNGIKHTEKFKYNNTKITDFGSNIGDALYFNIMFESLEK